MAAQLVWVVAPRLAGEPKREAVQLGQVGQLGYWADQLAVEPWIHLGDLGVLRARFPSSIDRRLLVLMQVDCREDW